MKPLILLLTAALALTACTSPPASNTQDSTGDSTQSAPIVVGAVMALTGPDSSIGEGIKQAMDVALEDINAKGGVDGHPLRIVYEDGQCTGKVAASALTKLITVDKVTIVLGGTCSGESLAMIPIAEQNNVLLFSMSASSPALTGASEHFLRNYPSDASAGVKVAQAAYEAKHTTIGILSESTDYAQAYREAFASEFTSLGGTIAADERYQQDSSDFRTQITKIKSQSPQAVFIAPQSPAKLSLILQQLRAAGYAGQIYTSEMAEAPDVLANTPKEIEGAVYATAYFDKESPEAQTLFAEMSERYGEYSGGLPLLYLAAGYDNVNMLAEALAACGGPDAICVHDTLLSVKDRLGAAGSLSMQANGDPSFRYELRTIVDGRPLAFE